MKCTYTTFHMFCHCPKCNSCHNRIFKMSCYNPICHKFCHNTRSILWQSIFSDVLSQPRMKHFLQHRTSIKVCQNPEAIVLVIQFKRIVMIQYYPSFDKNPKCDMCCHNSIKTVTCSTNFPTQCDHLSIWQEWRMAGMLVLMDRYTITFPE